MFKSSYKITTIWGIPIKLHISLLIIILIMILGDIPRIGFAAVPDGILLGIFLFGSIALHELGHSFVAIRKGCRVREITLAFFGGMASMERIPSKPRDEFQMAIAGPLVSLCLGTVGILLGLYCPRPQFRLTNYLLNMIFYIGIINIWLVLFNLVPAFPMDGGRVLRALLSRKYGRLKATYTASRIGKFLATAFGILSAINFFRGVPYSLIHLAIAIFIYNTAENEYRLVRMQETARQFGFDPGLGDDDAVEISPPPYEKGPGSKTEVHNTRDDLFPF